MRSIFAAVALSAVAAGIWMAEARSEAAENLREEALVAVNGVMETWQLLWDEAPQEVCGANEVSVAMTCPCSGFAYGEYGKMSLVRRRDGREIERLVLGPLFDGEEHPDPNAAVSGVAYISRWPMADDDLARDGKGDPRLADDIRRRAVTGILHPADYDHDGQAGEFLLQVGTLPCGKHQLVALGVSKRDGHLHPLASAGHPERPLVLPLAAWNMLRDGGGMLTTWQCGDHGAETRDELGLSAGDGVIKVKHRTFTCPIDGKPETLVEEGDL